MATGDAAIVVLAAVLFVLTAAPFGAPAPSASKAAPEGAYPPYQPAQTLSGHLKIICDGPAEKLMKRWVERFKKWHPQLDLIVGFGSNLAVVPTLTAGANELGLIGRQPWPHETELFRKMRGYELPLIRVGLGAHKTPGYSPALGIYVNAKNPIERVTLGQLDAIYSSERRRGLSREIKTWGDLGPTGEWAARPITAYAHRQPNGIRYFFQDVVTRGIEFKRSVVEMDMRRGRMGPDEVMARAVAEDTGAIGYGAFGGVVAGMKTIAVGETEKGPYYAGTLEEVASFTYPLAHPIYIVVDRPPGKPLVPKFKEFVSFVLSQEGQESFVPEVVVLPLPARLAAIEREKLK